MDKFLLLLARTIRDIQLRRAAKLQHALERKFQGAKNLTVKGK